MFVLPMADRAVTRTEMMKANVLLHWLTRLRIQKAKNEADLALLLSRLIVCYTEHFPISPFPELVFTKTEVQNVRRKTRNLCRTKIGIRCAGIANAIYQANTMDYESKVRSGNW